MESAKSTDQKSKLKRCIKERVATKREVTANGTVPYDPKEKLWRFFSFLLQNLYWEVSVFTTVFAELYCIWVFPKNLWPKLQIWEIICVKIHGVTQFVTANPLYYRHRQLCVLSKPSNSTVLKEYSLWHCLKLLTFSNIIILIIKRQINW